jgi:hypothetical protein
MEQRHTTGETPLERVVGARPRTEAVRNVNHDLIQVMSEKLDGVWRYDKYIEDAERENCPHCADLFRRLTTEDQRHGEQIRSESGRHVRQGTFH